MIQSNKNSVTENDLRFVMLYCIIKYAYLLDIDNENIFLKSMFLSYSKVVNVSETLEETNSPNFLTTLWSSTIFVCKSSSELFMV